MNTHTARKRFPKLSFKVHQRCWMTCGINWPVVTSVVSMRGLTLRDKPPIFEGYKCQILSNEMSQFIFHSVLLLSIPTEWPHTLPVGGGIPHHYTLQHLLLSGICSAKHVYCTDFSWTIQFLVLALSSIQEFLSYTSLQIGQVHMISLGHHLSA